MPRAALLLVLSLVPAIVEWQEPAARSAVEGRSEVLTLDQAVRLALENNRTVKNAALEAAKGEDVLAATRTRRFPNANLYTLGSQLLTPLNLEFKQGVFGPL